MDYKKIKQEFWEKGYVIFEAFFPEDLMDQYQQINLDHFRLNKGWEHTNDYITKSQNEVIPWFPYQEGKPYFDDIDKDDTFNKITDAILDNKWENLYCMMMFSKAGSIGQAWHQDCPPENSKMYNLNRLVYTHDITEDTGGAIVIMPEAHKAGVLPVGVPHEDIEGQVVYRPQKGTVIFLHGIAFIGLCL